MVESLTAKLDLDDVMKRWSADAGARDVKRAEKTVAQARSKDSR